MQKSWLSKCNLLADKLGSIANLELPVNHSFIRKIMVRAAISSFSVLVLLAGISPAKSGVDVTREPLVISADSWCPYVCSGPDAPGFSVELISEALKLQGRASVFISAPFERAERNIVKGKWQILPAVDEVFTPNLLIAKEPVAYTRWVFVVRSDSDWQYNGIPSLDAVRLGSVGGYVYSSELNDYILGNKDTDRVSELFGTTPHLNNMKMLMQGRIGAYIEDEAVIRYWAKHLGVTGQIKFVGVDNEAPLYTGWNRELTGLAEATDAAIRKMHNSETLQQLIKKYDIKLWK